MITKSDQLGTRRRLGTWKCLICGGTPSPKLGLRPGEEWIAARAGPALDVYETGDTIKIEAPLPGVKPEEVEVSITGNTLTIKGEHKAKQEVVVRPIQCAACG